MSEADRLLEIAKKADNDFFYLCKHILGYSKMTESPHREVCDHITRPGKRKKLSLLPRGSFKSSIITAGGSIMKIVKNPNIRILIASETQKNSKRYLREIKEHFEGNHKLRAIYGNFVPTDRTWTDYELIVSKRTAPKKEPTVMVSSLEKGTIVGMHFDLIILDDVVSQNNINTPEQIQKTLDYYKLLLSILDPDGELWMNGTRWSVHDLYGHILDPEGTDLDTFSILIRQAISPDGTLLMPTVLSREFLEEQKKAQGEEIFRKQYQNEPISSETAAFKIEQVKIYETSPRGLIYFMTIDPAISQAKKSDNSGAIVNGVDYYGNWYIQEAENLRLQPSELVKWIFDMAKKYNPIQCLGLEKWVIEKFLKEMLLTEMEARQFTIPIKELPTNNRVSKEARIRALQPIVEAGKLHLKKAHSALYHEISLYPQVRHDDLLDALKSQLQIVYPSDVLPETPKDEYAHLSVKERDIWKGVDKIARRKVRRAKWATW